MSSLDDLRVTRKIVKIVKNVQSVSFTIENLDYKSKAHGREISNS